MTIATNTIASADKSKTKFSSVNFSSTLSIVSPYKWIGISSIMKRSVSLNAVSPSYKRSNSASSSSNPVGLRGADLSLV